MKKETIQRFLNSCWVYLKRRNGYQYKCRIVEVTDEDLVIIDRNSQTSIFPLDEIIEISQWREK